MNEQRQQAYLNLIQHLLSCPNGEEPEILSANYDLLDFGLFQAMETVVKVFLQRGSEKAANSANRLKNLSTQIAQALKIPQSPQTQGTTENLDASYLNFLQQVLLAIAKNKDDLQVIYALLANNTDKLDEVLAEILRRRGTKRLREVEANVATSTAVDIVKFSELMAQFPLGNKASNIEIAISGYEVALSVLTEQASAQSWAQMQNNLGNAYANRILGERAQNIELAINAYTAALRVYTQQDFPEKWALTQNNLGAAYVDRILGEKAKNIELAIKVCSAALSVLTEQAFPQDWARMQNILGAAYASRILGEKAQNIELAIEAYTAALRVYTQQAFPQDWALTQINLGAAYVDRILGEKAQNIELAIQAYTATAALSVYTQQAFPQKWAMMHLTHAISTVEIILLCDVYDGLRLRAFSTTRKIHAILG